MQDDAGHLKNHCVDGVLHPIDAPNFAIDDKIKRQGRAYLPLTVQDRLTGCHHAEKSDEILSVTRASAMPFLVPTVLLFRLAPWRQLEFERFADHFRRYCWRPSLPIGINHLNYLWLNGLRERPRNKAEQVISLENVGTLEERHKFIGAICILKESSAYCSSKRVHPCVRGQKHGNNWRCGAEETRILIAYGRMGETCPQRKCDVIVTRLGAEVVRQPKKVADNVLAKGRRHTDKVISWHGLLLRLRCAVECSGGVDVGYGWGWHG
ncbi:MAG: hypothetical protein L6Q71_04650 [Planctomycetes bacterium]|nr:hypothetical protein [Planctomycetota bacterium]